MSDDMPGDSSPFPGSFAEQISQAQGGPTFGVMGGGSVSDMLPTHPNAQKDSSKNKYKFNVRYKQFDLTKPDEVAELEEVLSRHYNGEGVGIRQERMANDRDGFTIVTLSWVETEVKEVKKPEQRVDEEGKPYKLQQQYPFSTIEDGDYPGEGGTLGPPGEDLQAKENAEDKKEEDA